MALTSFATRLGIVAVLMATPCLPALANDTDPQDQATQNPAGVYAEATQQSQASQDGEPVQEETRFVIVSRSSWFRRSEIGDNPVVISGEESEALRGPNPHTLSCDSFSNVSVRWQLNAAFDMPTTHIPCVTNHGSRIRRD